MGRTNRHMMRSFVALLLCLGAVAALPANDDWVETSADPGGKPSDLMHGCGTTKYGGGKCSSDIFCPAMAKYNIKEKTKLDCIWGKAPAGSEHSASAMSAKGSVAEDYEKTGECEYSVYGNPCAWKKTMEYCESLRGTKLGCPEYCNKEELYCAARYLNPSYDWEDKPNIVPTGKCSKEAKEQCCTWQLDARYDAKCDPMNWNFKANDKKIKHCRAHAFSRSCNYYYDAALKIYQAKHGSSEGKAEHAANCKKSLSFNSCDPTTTDPDKVYLGDAFCQQSCDTLLSVMDRRVWPMHMVPAAGAVMRSMS